MVAKYADWWFLDYDKSATDLAGVEDSLRRAMDGMTRRAARYGRKVRFAFNPFVAFGATDEAALAHAKKLLTPDEPDADIRKMMSRVGPAMKSGCIGRPQKVRDQLMKYTDMGVELFLLKFVPTVERRARNPRRGRCAVARVHAAGGRCGGIANLAVPGAVQHEVMHCRPGTVTAALFIRSMERSRLALATLAWPGHKRAIFSSPPWPARPNNCAAARSRRRRFPWSSAGTPRPCACRACPTRPCP